MDNYKFAPYSKKSRIFGTDIDIQYGKIKHDWIIKITNKKNPESDTATKFIKTFHPIHFFEDSMIQIDLIYEKISEMISSLINKMYLGFSSFKISLEAMKQDSKEIGVPRSLEMVKRSKYKFIVYHITDIDSLEIKDPSVIKSLSMIKASFGKGSISMDVYDRSLKIFDFISSIQIRKQAAGRIRKILNKNG